MIELIALLAERGIEANSIHLPQFDESFNLTASSAESKGRVHSAGKVANRIPHDELLTDWNNDYAAFIVALTQRLNAAETDAERRSVIRQLHGVL